jgi:hypothetical protein
LEESHSEAFGLWWNSMKDLGWVGASQLSLDSSRG